MVKKTDNYTKALAVNLPFHANATGDLLYGSMGKQLYKVGLRKCKTCRIILSLNGDNFYKDKNESCGLGYDCKKCTRLRGLGRIRAGKWKKRPFYDYKRSARRKNIVFDLSKEKFNILLKGTCYYCDSTKKIGIDRVNNKKGYIIRNVVSCCTICNYMKRDSLKRYFISRCKKIASRF